MADFNWGGAMQGMVAAMGGPQQQQSFERQMAKREEEQKQIKERAQRQSKLEAALDTMGVLPKEISKTRSLDELEGILAGVQEKTKLGIQTLQQKQLEQAVAEQQAQATRQKQFQDTLANATMSPLGGVRPDMSPDRLQQAVLEAAVQSGDQETVMKALQAQGQQREKLGFGKEDVVDLGSINPALKGKFQVRQSAGSWQNVDTVPRTGGLPYDDRVKLMDRDALHKERRALVAALGKYMPAEQTRTVTEQLTGIDARLQELGGDGQGATDATGGPNVTESEYAKLKKGDLYWWNGKQIPKQ